MILVEYFQISLISDLHIMISYLISNFVGDNVIIGSYDARLCWFDIDLSTKPYKILR